MVTTESETSEDRKAGSDTTITDTTNICRSQEQGKTEKRHSNFWIGLYGFNWIVAWHFGQAWVEELVSSIRNKQAYYQRGLKAMKLIQQAL